MNCKIPNAVRGDVVGSVAWLLGCKYGSDRRQFKFATRRMESSHLRHFLAGYVTGYCGRGWK
ncbi:MAG: hypothetical protein RI964_829 [Pseudomonadota bacterium]|jgi:hypothetical protein